MVLFLRTLASEQFYILQASYECIRNFVLKNVHTVRLRSVILLYVPIARKW
jgi:hypothetical protein